MPVPPAPTRSFEVSSPDVSALRAWERHNAAALIELSCDVADGARFRGRETNVQLASVRLAHVRSTPHHVLRDRSLVAARPIDAVAVYLARRGDALVEHDDLRAVMRPGQMLVCDADRPFRRAFDHGLDELAVTVPRAAWTELTGSSTVVTTIIDIADNQYARALARQVGRALVPVPPLPADEQGLLETLAVVSTRGAVSSALAHRAAARAFVDDHLDDPGLAATDIASAVGISERQLSRVFAADDTTVPRHVLSRRLDLAHSLLSHAAPGLRTADVAARCGFSSLPYFTTAFKRRFGRSAGEVRRAAI